MEFDYIIYEKDKNIVRIIMNRPEKLNPLGHPMMEEIAKAVDCANDDDDVRVMIIKGAGRAFSAGHDIPMIGMDIKLGPEYAGKRPTAKMLIDRDRWLKRTFYQHIWNSPKPIIAQVHGYCIYGGNNLQLVCDLTIAAEDTQFQPKGETVVTIATYLPPDPFAIGLGPRHRCVRMNGKDAERYGMINKAVPLDKLEEEVESLARLIAVRQNDALDINKTMLNGLMDFDGFEAAYRVTHLAHAMGTLQRIRPGEFNIFKARRDVGVTEAIRSRQQDV